MKKMQIILSCVFIVCLLSGSANAETLDGQAVTQESAEAQICPAASAEAPSAAETPKQDEIEAVPPSIEAQPDTENGGQTKREALPPTVSEQADIMETESLVDALPQDANEILGDVSLTDMQMGDKGFNGILERDVHVLSVTVRVVLND